MQSRVRWGPCPASGRFPELTSDLWPLAQSEERVPCPPTLWTRSPCWRRLRFSRSAPPADPAAPAGSVCWPRTRSAADGSAPSSRPALARCSWECWSRRCRGSCCSPPRRSRPPASGRAWSGSPTWSRWPHTSCAPDTSFLRNTDTTPWPPQQDMFH